MQHFCNREARVGIVARHDLGQAWRGGLDCDLHEVTTVHCAITAPLTGFAAVAAFPVLPGPVNTLCLMAADAAGALCPEQSRRSALHLLGGAALRLGVAARSPAWLRPQAPRGWTEKECRSVYINVQRF